MDSVTPTTISLSWTTAGSVVDIYEVAWLRNTSGECPDEDEGTTAITDGSTSYNIMEVEEDSIYIITVVANNAVGSSALTVSAMTMEAGKLVLVVVFDEVSEEFLYSHLQLHLLLPLQCKHQPSRSPAYLFNGMLWTVSIVMDA